MDDIKTLLRKLNWPDRVKAILTVFMAILLILLLSGPGSWGTAIAAVTSRNVSLVTHYQGGSVFNIFAVQGGMAYIDASINGQKGLHVFDLASQQSIASYFTIDPNGTIIDVLIEGNMAYVLFSPSTSFAGDFMQSINLDTGQYIGLFRHPDAQYGQFTALEKNGQYLYIGSLNPKGVYAVDTSVLVGGNYTLFSHFPTAYDPGGMALVYNNLFVTFSRYPDGGMVILNLMYPLSPCETGRYEMNEVANYISGSQSRDLVFLQGSTMLHLIDVIFPENPKVLNTIPCSVGKFGINENTLFLKGQSTNRRVEVWDATFPQTPMNVGFYNDTDWRTAHLFSVGNTIYAAAGSGGLVTLEYVPPQLLVTPDGEGWSVNGTPLGVGTETQLLPGDLIGHQCPTGNQAIQTKLTDIIPCPRSSLTANQLCIAENFRFVLFILFRNTDAIDLSNEEAHRLWVSCSNTDLGFLSSIAAIPCSQLNVSEIISLSASAGSLIGELQSGLLGYQAVHPDLMISIDTGTATIVSAELIRFFIGHLPGENKSLIVADIGSLTVTPKNPALPPFTLTPGKLALVTADSVSVLSWRKIFLPLILKQ